MASLKDEFGNSAFTAPVSRNKLDVSVLPHIFLGLQTLHTKKVSSKKKKLKKNA